MSVNGMRTNPLHVILEQWNIILFSALAAGLLATAFSFLTPLQYSSSVRVLITQPGTAGLDPYTVLKATESIANSLTQLIYSSTFFTNVIQQNASVDPTYFPQDELSKRRLWRRTLDVSVTPSTGILTLTAYHPSREQARGLVEGAAREMALQAPNYFGTSVRIQVIDAPLDSRWFARPRFVSNAALGFFIGALLGTAWILSRKPARHEI